MYAPVYQMLKDVSEAIALEREAGNMHDMTWAANMPKRDRLQVINQIAQMGATVCLHHTALLRKCIISCTCALDAQETTGSPRREDLMLMQVCEKISTLLLASYVC